MNKPTFGARHDAAWAIYQRMNARLCEFIEMIGEYEAPAIYWLESDCSESYCLEHGIAARAEEFGLGLPLDPDRWSRRTKLEDAFFEGLSGSPYGLGSDHAESCTVCGKTLVYSLTDYGTDCELDHFDTADWSRPCPPEVGYELDRAVCNTFHSESRPQLVKACRIVAQAWRAAKAARAIA